MSETTSATAPLNHKEDPQAPKYDNEPAPPAYTSTEPPRFERQSSDSDSSRSLQESEVSREKQGSECGQCCHDCVRCFGCCSGTPNCTSTDQGWIGTLVVILSCGFCAGFAGQSV